MYYKNPERYGLVGWRKVKRKGRNTLEWLGAALFVLLIVAWPITAIYIVAHFVLKYW